MGEGIRGINGNGKNKIKKIVKAELIREVALHVRAF